MDDNQMHGPVFRWEWNINTVAVLLGFGAGLVAWGYTLAELRSGLVFGDKLEVRVSALETENQLLANHELRIATVERQVVDASSAMRSVENAINALTVEIKVTREILQRFERDQRRSQLQSSGELGKEKQ